MIDLEKEREAFEDAYQHHSFIKHVYRAGNHYSVMPNLNIAKDKKKIIVDLANSSWNAWQRCSLRAQEEITELKQKLEKLESGEFVLVPRELNGNIIEDMWSTFDKRPDMQLIHNAMIEAVEKDHE